MSKQVETKPSDAACQQYVEQGGVNCPCCGSDQLDGGSVEIDGAFARQEVRCLDCRQDWTDEYRLVGIRCQ